MVSFDVTGVDQNEADGESEAGVDGGQGDERDDAHDGQIEPRVVDAHVDRVARQPRAVGHQPRGVGAIERLQTRSVLEPARSVVQRRHHAHDADHEPDTSTGVLCPTDTH